MKFLYPQFLWALLALLLPLIVHLFNFRKYKTVYFSNTRVLQTVKQRSNSTKQVQKLLVLLSRMLAITALVLAFAQPYFPTAQSDTQQKRVLALYLDNSLSMLEDGANGALLNEAKLNAVALIKALPKSVQVQILNNEFEGRQQRYYTPDEAIALLDQTQLSYAQRTFKEVLNRVQSQANRANADEVELILFSDFQTNAFDFNQTPLPEKYKLKVVPFTALAQKENIAIDSVWLTRQALLSGVPQQINVQLSSYGLQATQTTSLNLLLNNKLYGTQSVSLEPGKSAVTSFNFLPQEERFFTGKLSLDAPAPFFDNTLYFALNLGNKPNVVAVAPQVLHDPLLNLLGSNRIDFKVYQSSLISTLDFQNANTLLLTPEQTLSSGFLSAIENTLKQGGNVLLFPGNEAKSVNQILAYFQLGQLGEKITGEKRAASINWEDPFYKDAFLRKSKNPDLPIVQHYFNTAGVSRRAQTLLSFANQDFLVARLPVHNGNIILSSSGLATEQSNLMNHKALVPILLNSINTSVPQSPLYNQYGKTEGQRFVASNGDASPLYISTENTDNFILPQRKRDQDIEVNTLPSSIAPGVYEVFSDQNMVGKLAVNSSALESDWRFMDEAEFPEYADIMAPKTQTLAASIGSNYTTQTYWRLLLMLALLFFMVELFLLKYTK